MNADPAWRTVETNNTPALVKVQSFLRPREAGQPVIVDPHSNGSGFVISEQGHILTAAHLIPEARKGYDVITVITRASTMLKPETGADGVDRYEFIAQLQKLEVGSLGYTNDVALLKVDAGPSIEWHPVCIGDDSLPRSQDSIFKLGYGQDLRMRGKSGTLTSTDERPWNADISVAGGDSGGPVFDTEGRVIAFVIADIQTNPNFAFLLPISSATVLYPLMLPAHVKRCEDSAAPVEGNFKLDRMLGIYCQESTVKEPRASFFDYLTVTLKSCEDGSPVVTGSRSYLVPSNGSYEIGYAEQHRYPGYNLCLPSHFTTEGNGVLQQSLRALEGSLHGRCSFRVDANRAIKFDYLAPAGDTKSAAFDHHISGPPQRDNDLKQVPYNRKFQSSSLDRLDLGSDETTNKNLVEAMLSRDFNFDTTSPNSTPVFRVPDFDGHDSDGSKSGRISNISVSLFRRNSDKTDSYLATWSWTGSHGTQKGSQTVIIKFMSSTGAVLQIVRAGLDRSGCYYQGNSQDARGSLDVAKEMISRIEVSLTAVEGKQGKC